MKSPFPGMDPYIEASGLFEDFHLNVIDEIARALAKAVPRGYLVRKGERPYIVLSEKEGPKDHIFQPDVGVVGPALSPGRLAVADPDVSADSIPMRALITEEFRESFVEIYVTRPTRELVTCIEVLSPSNKRRNTEGWDTYLRKRRSLLLGSANFLEIDLLRNGDRMPMVDAWPSSPYTLLLARRGIAPRCRVWPAHYMRPLPIIPVPLVKPDPDVPLNLQAMIETIYADFRYDEDINYTQLLKPPVAAEDASWLAEQLQRRS